LEGEKEVEKMYQGYLRETLAPGVREKLAEAKLEGREAATAELSAKFKQWWSVREHQIHRNARAYALYEGSVTQIRRQQNAEGAEQEQEALTTRIATVMAERIVVTHHHNEVGKSIWRHACNPDSPLYVGSKLLEGTSFYENLLPLRLKRKSRKLDWTPSYVSKNNAPKTQRGQLRGNTPPETLLHLPRTNKSSSRCHLGFMLHPPVDCPLSSRSFQKKRKLASSPSRTYRRRPGGGACKIL
jgi:hypothetical protein